MARTSTTIRSRDLHNNLLRTRLVVPLRLYRSIVYENNSFLLQDSPRLLRDDEIEIGLAHPPTGHRGSQLGVANTGMDCPLAEPNRQRAQHPRVAGRLVDRIEVVAVHQFVIVGRVSSAPHLFDEGPIIRPNR